MDGQRETDTARGVGVRYGGCVVEALKLLEERVPKPKKSLGHYDGAPALPSIDRHCMHCDHVCPHVMCLCQLHVAPVVQPIILYIHKCTFYRGIHLRHADGRAA